MTRAPSKSTLYTWLQRELPVSGLLPAVPTALICYFIILTFSVSFAALIFRGPLAPALSTGIGIALYTAFAVGVTIALTSSVPGAIGIPSDRTAPILASLAGSIVATLPPGTSDSTRLQTVLAALFLTTLLTGVVLALLGRSRLGSLIRFVPYPVIGGFMAGAGWLLVMGAFTVLCGLELTWSNVARLGESGILVKWLPSLIMALALITALRHWKHFLVVPAFVVGSAAVFYLVAAATGTSMSDLHAHGWLPGPFPESIPWNSLSPSRLSHASWPSIWLNSESLGTVLFVSAISVLMISSALELASGRDIDGDRELQAVGLANLISVMGGGITGLPSLSISSLVQKLGPKSRWVGLLSALGLGLTLFFGPAVVNYMPVPVLGGLLLFLGTNFLAEWLVDSFRKIPRSDYLIIVLILVVICFVGLIQGVGVGLLTAVGLFTLRYSRVDVVRHTFSGDEHRSNVDRTEEVRKILQEKKRAIHVIKLQGFMFFGTAHSLLESVKVRLKNPLQEKLRFLVIDFRHVIGLDSSALVCFVKLQQLAQAGHFYVVLSSLQEDIRRALQNNPEIARNQGLVFVTHPDLDHAIEWCEVQILSDSTSLSIQGSTPLEQLLQAALQNQPAVARRISGFFQRREIAAGTILTEQGQHSHSLYFIESGQISARLKTAQGEILRLRTMGPGSVVGEIGLYLQIPRTATLLADQASVIHELGEEALRQMEQRDAEAAAAFHHFLARTLAERLQQTNIMLEAALR